MPLVIAKQFGFSTGSGLIGNLVDRNILTFWQPISTDFAAYGSQFFLSDKVTLNVGASFPALEFDLGEPKRIPQFLLKVETLLTLGPSILIGSTTGATSPADTLQVGDVLLGQYSEAQICGNHFLEVPIMRDSDVRKRFLRFLQRSNVPSAAAPTPGPANSVTFDYENGVEKLWQVVGYSGALTIETWAGGASGGVPTVASNGGDTYCSIDAYFNMHSVGGVKSAGGPSQPGGVGGTSSGGNTENTTGGDGEAPAPLSGAPGYSGAGGTSPHGGLGGSRIYQVFEIGRNYYYGNDGQAPGGGGGGHSMWYPVGDAVFDKKPGGGAGGYSKHVVPFGAAYAQPGSYIGLLVGAGGASTSGDGRGADGRVRFSWT